MRAFYDSAYYSYQGLFAWLTPSMFIAQKVLIPLGQIMFFSFIGAYGGSQPLDFYLIGNAMVTASAACVFICLAISEERGMGTLAYLMASPANRAAMFFGRSTIHILEGIVHVIVGFAWAMMVFGLDLPASSWGGVFISIVVGTVAVSGLGLLLGGISYLVLDAGLFANAATFILLFLSGANIPLEELPAELRAVSYALPLTRSIEAARAFVAGGSFIENSSLLLADLALGIVYALAGLALFSWLETQARHRGTLENV